MYLVIFVMKVEYLCKIYCKNIMNVINIRIYRTNKE